MIPRIDLRGRVAAGDIPTYRTVVPRASFDVATAVEVVRPICEDVRERGEAALIEYAARFDQVALERVRVPGEAIASALGNVDPDVRAGLEESIARVRRASEEELGAGVTTIFGAGARVRQRLVPVRRVGLYAPGGIAPLVSSVVMNVVPAQVAGVTSLALASPPQREHAGLPHPNILAACGLLGVEEVYAAGGAQAVAMFAYGFGAGTSTSDDACEPVDMITGPGNIYTVAAKRLLKGRVGIDSEAGPTEIAILADDTADPTHVAADLISQAEHDTLAASVLITDSKALADAVDGELETQVAATKHVERIRTALGAEQSATVLVDDLDQGLQVVDAYAAEHLEIQTRGAAELAERVRNAGAIFVGPHAPVSLGDYCAGSNHVLPTGGCARHSSGLSVRTFLRAIHVIEYDAAALSEVAGHVVALAHAEDLPAHAAAVRVRFDESDH